jgi:excisionase family DNA binding protein
MNTALKLLTRNEAAELLRISLRTLDNLTEPRGNLPCIRVGRQIRYSIPSLNVWLERRLAGLEG